MSWDDLPLFSQNLKTDSEAEPKPEKGVEKPIEPVAPTAAPRSAVSSAVDPEKGRPKAWTVSELTQQIRSVVEPQFLNVWVQGEVSNYRPAASGHAYFSIKDQGASISAAFFGWGSRRRPFEIKDGLKVLCRGKVTIYPNRGVYQITVDQIEPLGQGALQVAFEQLKARLSAEGLFAKERKRALPRYPTRIAVVTSPSGAAIQDMLNILARRAPWVRVTIIPSVVQGDSAAAQIIRGLEQAQEMNLGEVVVLARGGGSIEDLWCFNDENLARAISRSRLPVISAVGHEIDFTISDFVADLRAPTPSAAAELVTHHWVEAVPRLREHEARLVRAIRQQLHSLSQRLSFLCSRVISPKDRLRVQMQRCDELFLRLERAIHAKMERKRSALMQGMGKLDALSPLRVLERGYSIVRESDLNAGVIKSAAQVRTGQELKITFYDGEKSVKAL